MASEQPLKEDPIQKKQEVSTLSSLAAVPATILTLVTVLAAFALSLLYTLAAAFVCLVPRRFRRHDITGKVALVTGGGSGIGRLLILKLAAKGAKVITWDVNTAGNTETTRLTREAGYDCQAYTVDLCDRHAIYRAAADMSKQGIKVDILVNNAGIVTGRNFLESPDTDVERTFAVNVMSHFWTAKSFLPAMLESNSGHVVTIASMAGKVGVNKLIDYCASKFAAVGFDESLRAELMVNNNDGVFTTLVCPYYINTGMFDGVRSKLIPILEPNFVADEIVDGILLRCKEVVLPFYSNIFVLLKLGLSHYSQHVMLSAVGLNCSMDQFVGRRGKQDQEYEQSLEGRILTHEAQKLLFYKAGCQHALEDFMPAEAKPVARVQPWEGDPQRGMS